MENMEIYNSTRAVPQEAKKEIKGGRLSGKTDINPMWRIKTADRAVLGRLGSDGGTRLQTSVWSPELTAKWPPSFKSTFL